MGERKPKTVQGNVLISAEPAEPSNHQDDISAHESPYPRTTKFAGSIKTNTTNDVVRSKRTGEGQWEEDIQDEVYFQYDGAEEGDVDDDAI